MPMFYQAFSSAEITLLEHLAEHGLSLSELSQHLSVSSEILDPTLEDLTRIGWVTKDDGKYALNSDLRIANRFGELVSLSYNIPPSFQALKNFVGTIIANAREALDGLKVVTVIGSYGTNDYVDGVSDIDLVVLYEEAKRDRVNPSRFAGQVEGVSIEVWDISTQTFDALAKHGRFFALWVLRSGLGLYGDYTPARIGNLDQQNLMRDIERDFVLALGKKLANIERSVDIFNVFVNVSKRASVVFNAYFNDIFSRDGLVSASALGLSREYEDILRAKVALRAGEDIQLFDRDSPFSIFHRDLYGKYLSVGQRTLIIDRIDRLSHNDFDEIGPAARALPALRKGYELYRSFFEDS